MLQTLDQHWRDHLANLDHLRQGIHLRGYAQKNPKQEYKRESFELFSDMLDRIKQDVVKVVLTVQVRTPEDVQAVEEAPAVTNVKYQHADYDAALAAEPDRCRRRRRPRRSCAQARRSDATIRALAGRARNTSSATESSGLADVLRRSIDSMPVRYTPPRARPAVAGPRREARHRRRENQEAGSATICCSPRSIPGTTAAGVFTQNRFCAAPVIVCRRHLEGDGPHPRARRQRRQRQCGHGRRRHRGAEATCARRRVDARLRAARGAAVLDRRDHGAAAGREDRRGAARGAATRSPPITGSRRCRRS